MQDETNGAEANPASADANTTHAPADFAAFDVSNKIGVMEVRDLDGAVMYHADHTAEHPHPFTITFRSKHSPVVKNLLREQQDRRIAQNMRTRQAVKTAVIERDDIEVLVAATLKWDIVLEGRIPPSNSNEYRAAYTKYDELKRQGDEFVGVAANFLKG